MVAIFALASDSFLSPRYQSTVAATLRLCEPQRCSLQLTRMIYLFPSGEREQIVEAGVDSNTPISDSRNDVRLCVNKQAQIPSACSLNDPAAFDLPLGECLPVIPDAANAQDADATTRPQGKCIWKRNTVKAIASTFKARRTC